MTPWRKHMPTFSMGGLQIRSAPTCCACSHSPNEPGPYALASFSASSPSEVAASTTTRTPWMVPVAAFLTASPAASLTSYAASMAPVATAAAVSSASTPTDFAALMEP